MDLKSMLSLSTCQRHFKKRAPPFVWHFKQGHFNCRQNSTWMELIELFVNADGRIFVNPETQRSGLPNFYL